MYSRARKQLENSDEVHVHAFVLDVHFSRTTVRVRHVAVEHDVLAVAADRRAGRRPVAFGAPRAGLSQAIDRAPVHARKNDLVFVEQPITSRWRLEPFVVAEEFRRHLLVIGCSTKTRSFLRAWTGARSIAWLKPARGAPKATGRRPARRSAATASTSCSTATWRTRTVVLEKCTSRTNAWTCTSSEFSNCLRAREYMPA